MGIILILIGSIVFLYFFIKFLIWNEKEQRKLEEFNRKQDREMQEWADDFNREYEQMDKERNEKFKEDLEKIRKL